MTKTEVNRLHWIDSLRGLAAMGVVVMHMYDKLRRLHPENPIFSFGSISGFFISDFLNLGKIGVVIFFFVSGYVIPYSLNNRTLGQFGVTRFFRLYPAYWLSILLSIFIIGTPPLLQLLANITMFQRFAGIADINAVYWTLQIEIIFYFICAFLFYKGILYNSKTIVQGFYFFLTASLFLSVTRYFTGLKLPVAVPLALGVMFLGIMVRKLSSNDETFTRNYVSKFFLLYIVALLPICFLAYNKDYGYNETWYKYFVSYVTAFIFFILFFHYKWSNKLFSFLGAISYSLYLLHPIMGLGLMSYIKNNLHIELSATYYIITFLTFSISSSVLCYYFIEKPSIKIGKLMMKSDKHTKSLVSSVK